MYEDHKKHIEHHQINKKKLNINLTFVAVSIPIIRIYLFTSVIVYEAFCFTDIVNFVDSGRIEQSSAVRLDVVMKLRYLSAISP